MSRMESIQTLVEVFVANAISGVTIGNAPVAIDTIAKAEFPYARVLFSESDPERLPFRQERRIVNGQIVLGFISGTNTPAEEREICNLALEAIRDSIFADETLTQSVDYAAVSSAAAHSQIDDEIVYGMLELVAEEVF